MTARRAPESLDRLPVLTEVVRAAGVWERVDPQPAPPVLAPPAAPSPPLALVGGPSEAPPAALDAEQLEESVLAAVQQHVDLMFEYRLREAIAPVLARAADQLIKDLREPLAADLRDVVQRAVAQEIARRRHR